MGLHKITSLCASHLVIHGTIFACFVELCHCEANRLFGMDVQWVLVLFINSITLLELSLCILLSCATRHAAESGYL